MRKKVELTVTKINSEHILVHHILFVKVHYMNVKTAKKGRSCESSSAEELMLSVSHGVAN